MQSTLALQADRLRVPYQPMVLQTANMMPVPITSDVNELGAILIFLAAIIAIFGFMGIVYQCSMWSK